MKTNSDTLARDDSNVIAMGFKSYLAVGYITVMRSPGYTPTTKQSDSNNREFK